MNNRLSTIKNHFSNRLTQRDHSDKIPGHCEDRGTCTWPQEANAEPDALLIDLLRSTHEASSIAVFAFIGCARSPDSEVRLSAAKGLYSLTKVDPEATHSLYAEMIADPDPRIREELGRHAWIAALWDTAFNHTEVES